MWLYPAVYVFGFKALEMKTAVFGRLCFGLEALEVKIKAEALHVKIR